MTAERNRLKWLCRRGQLELDLLFTAFLDEHYALMSRQEKESFARLLALPDHTLWTWLQGSEEVKDRELRALVEKIR